MESKYDSRRIWLNTGTGAKLKNLALEERTVKRAKSIYRQAQRDIEAQVEQIYSTMGALSKANRWEFPGINNAATRKDISRLIKAIDKAGLTDKVPEQLTRRMNVLQVKQMDIWLKIHQAGQESHAVAKNAILKTMQNSGKAWAEALEAGAASFVGFDRNICGYMMGANWAGGNFSSRLWNASEETWGKVRDELTRALANGQQPATTKAHIRNLLTQAHNPDAKGSGGIAYDVERIICTENAKASTDADIARWKDAGVTKIQWNAVLEKNTCPHCADRDGRVYLLKDIYKLDTVPLHPNCRCFFTAYDETAAKYPDTTYYKNEDGEYEEVQWAPYRALIGKDGKLRTSPLQVADYFFKASPWMSYKAPTTGVTYQGEIDPQILDVTERAVQTISDIFPEIRERLDISFNGEIYMHRGTSTVWGNKIEGLGGLTDAGNRQLTISYPSRAGGKSHLHELAQSMAEDYLKGHISSPDVNHAIVHELGHVLDYDLRLKGRANAEQIVLKATRTKTWEQAKTVIGAKISTYGTTNPDEAFAELFAKMMTQRPDLQDDITARFVTELQKARRKPATKRRIGVK